MASSVFIKADEIAEELEISKALAYRMIHKWNEDLKAKGYTTVQGRVSRQYYKEQLYGLSGTERRE
jgi:transposase